jgi:general secretion pathway protein J
VTGADEVAVTGLLEWQVFYYRSDAWTNPLSSDTTTTATRTTTAPGTPPVSTTARAAATPDGVRIILNLAPGQAITGELTRDWVRPTLSGGRTS